jgi:hypothetical protein
VSVLPTTIPANETENLSVTISLNLKPGVYFIGIFFGVQSSGPVPFEFSSLNPFPVIVKS